MSVELMQGAPRGPVLQVCLFVREALSSITEDVISTPKICKYNGPRSTAFLLLQQGPQHGELRATSGCSNFCR